MQQYRDFNPGAQRGAALYVALIMLILLALIGIAAMQVASLQERMSANYLSSTLAFQRAETRARERERLIEAQVNSGEVPALNIAALDCANAFDPAGWTATDAHVRRLDLCFPNSDLGVGKDQSELTDQIFQITAFNTDRDIGSSAEAVVDTVFIP